MFVGLLLCFSNMYFGLQTGWVTMGSLQSSLLGFGILKLFRAENFNPIENVLVQTTAVATATMPLAGGFVSVIPAMGMLEPAVTLSWWELFLFSFGLAFFGVFAAVPLRRQTILKEKLPFPSGTATAHMIKMLHGKAEIDEAPPVNSESNAYSMKKKWIVLAITFGVSSLYGILSYFFPVLRNIPIFSWWGWHEATLFSWVITPSLSYVGQGMIMGTRIGVSMFFGAIFGWGILGPIAKMKHWAPGRVGDFETGASGWIMWVSLAIMIAESFSSLGCVIFITLYKRYCQDKKYIEDEEEVDPSPRNQRVPRIWWIPGLIVSMIACVFTAWGLFMSTVPFYQPLIATILSLFVAILGVRALGETDVNPVSGVGKVTQLIFGVVAPGNIISNLVAGAISEAGAQQAGDMMQDLKTGHLIKASPRAQFFAQIIGSAFSTVFAVAAFVLYTNAWQVPGPEFQVPTAKIWKRMAELVNGGTLAPNVIPFCIGCGVVAMLLPILSNVFPKYSKWFPSGIAFAIAIYVTPNWTIPRVVGAVVHFLWSRYSPVSHKELMIIVASGFVLGEGVTSIVTALLKTANVPFWSCSGTCLAPCADFC
uniref:Uncharacterized protein n=1 Tax=Arcella intermedia TaxID=1963864 RepID=A0A6B2L039_9EUKA